MAIEKRFIHFKRFSDFNSKKLSANEANTQYTVGVSGAIQNGAPDILYQSYVWIKDTKQQWTHGQLYDGTNLNEAGFLAGEETSDQLDDVETHTYVKYVPQTLTDEQKAQTRINIDAISGSSLKTINGESIVGIGDITISGGSEDIRYFTEFTLEDFIEASKTSVSVPCDVNKLKIAAANNKLICIQHENADTGYTVASYSYNDYGDYSSIRLRLEYNGNVYTLEETDADTYLAANYPVNLTGSIVESLTDIGHIIEVQDNTLYVLYPEGEFCGLGINIEDTLYKGSTIRFFSSHYVDNNGDNRPMMLELFNYAGEILWANGVMPEIEMDTYYELSLTHAVGGMLLAVLAPFKPVS